MTRAEGKRLRAGVAFTSLWIVGLAVFTAYPVAASLFYSFCDYSILKAPVWCGLENYRQLAQDELFWKSLRNTLFYAGLSVPLGTAVALGLAVLLNCEVGGRSLFRLLFFMPSIVPVVASAMLWLWIFNGKYGLMNGFLDLFLSPFGLHGPAWLADPSWSKPALVIMSLWGTDGASAWRRFIHVTLPAIAPVVAFNAIMALIGAMQLFAQAYIMSEAANGNGNASDGNPARSTLFYTIYLFSTAFQDLRMGYASAMAYVLFLITAALTWMAAQFSRGRYEDSP
jgi:multiple sugar transport system permease protein